MTIMHDLMNPTLTSYSLYKDLNSDAKANFPPVTRERLSDYLKSCQMEFQSKIESLYSERYIRYIRAAPGTGNIYVTAAVWAEMRKTTCYKVDISLSMDGVVDEAQCECAVGQGPAAHCKHVITVVFALTKLSGEGAILTEMTCTQVLQTFHQARPHHGSPVKARDLSKIRGKPNAILYDPRPAEYKTQDQKEAYNDRTRHMAINYQTHMRLPLLQLYPPANIRGLAHDHDYFKLSMEQKFLEDEKISNISNEDVIIIEQTIRMQHRNRIWNDERSKRLTSSHFGEICKMTDRRDVPGLLRSLTSSKFISSKSLAHGLKYENIAVQEFEHRTGIKTVECGLFVSSDTPVLAATADRIIDANTLVEIKCPFSAKDKTITAISVPYLDLHGDALTLKKSHNYYYQIQGQLYCTKRKLCKFVVYTLKDIKIMDIEMDESFIDAMVDKLLHFYDSHFKEFIVDKMVYLNTFEYNFS